MCNYARIVGRNLRQIRNNRQLTLQQAASQFPVSVATLSRKERGFEQIHRDDIRRAIHVYELNAQECYHLWYVAGYIPEPTHLPGLDEPLPQAVKVSLDQVSLPAAIVDPLSCIQAWNDRFASVWPVSLDLDKHQPHLVSDLFRHSPAPEFVEPWQENLSQIVRLFYERTITLSRNPAFLLLIEQLEEEHGQIFSRLWEQVQFAGVRNGNVSRNLMSHLILGDGCSMNHRVYFVTSSTLPASPDYELYTLVPCDSRGHAVDTVVPNAGM